LNKSKLTIFESIAPRFFFISLPSISNLDAIAEDGESNVGSLGSF